MKKKRAEWKTVRGNGRGEEKEMLRKRRKKGIRFYLRYKLSPVWKVKTEKEGKEERGKGKRIPLKAGMDKFPYPPPGGGSLSRLLGKNIKWKRFSWLLGRT